MKWCPVLALLLLSACSTPAAVVALAEGEHAILDEARARLEENRLPVRRSLDDLEESSALALAEGHALTLSLAKAKLLEAMRSPWTSAGEPNPARKEVALYHLYEVHDMERAARDARVAARGKEIDRVRDAHSALLASMDALVLAEQALLRQLRAPGHRGLVTAVDRALAEVDAFSTRLSGANDSEMRRLGRRVDREEQRAEEAWSRLRNALLDDETVEEGR